MDKCLLDLAKIKINLTGKKHFLAKVTLNWNDEFEVRFFRISKRANGTLWFQPPALEKFNWARCFGVIKKEDWHKLEKRVIKTFFEHLREESAYSKEYIDELERGNQGEDVDANEIPDTFT